MTTAVIRPQVAVVIVTYNSASTIEHCLTALAAALDELDVAAEVIVWDNASVDTTVSLVERHALARRNGFTLVASSSNLGFGGANNAAVSQTHAPVLLLLNPDAFLDDPLSITHLLAAMDEGRHDAGPRTGIVGPFLVNADGSHQVGDAGHAETLSIAILWAFGLNMLPGVPGSFLSRSYSADTPAFGIDWVCGACLMIERALFTALDGFDGRIFLYSEDVDLCLRARAMGRRVLYVPGVRVRHIQGVSLATGAISTTWLDSRFSLFGRACPSRGQQMLFSATLVYGFAWRWLIYAIVERCSATRRDRGMATKMRTYTWYSLNRMRRLATMGTGLMSDQQ